MVVLLYLLRPMNSLVQNLTLFATSEISKQHRNSLILWKASRSGLRGMVRNLCHVLVGCGLVFVVVAVVCCLWFVIWWWFCCFCFAVVQHNLFFSPFSSFHQYTGHTAEGN